MTIILENEQKIKIINSDDLYKIMQDILLRENKIDRDKEHFWVCGLGANNQLLFIELISMGSKKKALVEPMEVFSVALQKRAVKIIMVHNHPTNEIAPSEADKDVTDRLIQVGLIVDTPVVNHLIITEKSYLSFLDIGLMKQLYESEKYVPPYKLEERRREEGRQEGREEGMLKTLKEVAKRMKEKGNSIETIKEITGLSETQIKRIRVKKKK